MNIHYKTDAIAKFYSHNRVQWDQFYPSEQFMFEKVFKDHGAIETVLDAGCACGGLGRALHQRFGIKHYTGVDINAASVDRARSEESSFPIPVQFECADIAQPAVGLRGRVFDLVVSLSCADWNCDTREIVRKCWDYTADGGYFLFSFRLTNKQSLASIETSYQYVKFHETDELRGDEERAPYVVMNVREMLEMVNGLRPRPARLLGYGYWGSPSRLAVLPYDKIVFSVLAVQKKSDSAPTSELILPLDLYA